MKTIAKVLLASVIAIAVPASVMAQSVGTTDPAKANTTDPNSASTTKMKKPSMAKKTKMKKHHKM
jgi:hypothetical protein